MLQARRNTSKGRLFTKSPCSADAAAASEEEAAHRVLLELLKLWLLSSVPETVEVVADAGSGEADAVAGDDIIGAVSL